MNKKFLSAILFGALMVTSTGTFVSCKDYDDDIEDLQEQINKLATKEDMASQIATLQAALTTAQSEATAAKASAEQALAKVNSAESAATEAEKAAAQAALDAANAKSEAIKAAQAEVANVKAELEATIESKFEAEKTALAKTISELTETVTKLTGLTTDMITSIDLQEAKGFTTKLDLNYYQIATSKKWDGKSSYTFGKDLEGSFTLNAGEIFATPSSLLVSVAPANAALPTEILSIVDSKGTSINDYITLTSKSYTGQLYKASRAAANGLYSITAELKKDADKDAFKKLLGNEKDSYVAFAIAATKEGRTVTSTYDVTVQSTSKTLAEAEDINVYSTIKSTIEAEDALKNWVIAETETATPNDEKCYPVADGEEFTIKVASKADAGKSTTSSKVLASYVVVDINNKALSTTDKAAINSLTITGDVNKVSKENVFDITIGGTYAKGVVVPLKVVTIDYTGVETSRVVWVKAGGNSEITQTVAYTITPNAYIATPKTYSFEQIKGFTVPAGYASYKLSIVDEDDKINFNNNNATLKFYEDAEGKKEVTNLDEVSKIAYAKFASTVNLQQLVDNKVYEGIVKFYNAEGTFLSQSTIKIQKVLPTAFPSAFTAKTNAIDANGVLTIYPEPEANATTGVFAFSKAFNGLDGANALKNIVFSSSDVNLVGDGGQKPENAKFDNTAYTINTINADLINDGKTYGAKVAYDYGDIRSAYKVGDKTVYNHSVDWGTTFSIKFGCLTVDSKYKWAQEPVVYYREDAVIKGKVTTSNGKVTGFTNVFTAVDPYNKEVDPFDASDKGWTTWANALNTTPNTEIKLITNGNRVNEFFNAKYVVVEEGGIAKTAIELTKTSAEVVLTGDVETKVVLVITDKFGHKHEVEALTFTMKKSH